MRDVAKCLRVHGNLDELPPDMLEVVQLFVAISFTGKGLMVDCLGGILAIFTACFVVVVVVVVVICVSRKHRN